MKKLSLLISAFLIGSLLQAQNLPSYLPANGLVGWWPFNGNANDESGNGNNGTVNGATLTTDRFGNAGKAYGFDGLSNYIEVPDNSTIDLTNQFTIAVWAKINDLNPNSSLGEPTRTMIGKPRSSASTGYLLSSIDYNTPTFSVGLNNDIQNLGTRSFGSLDVGQWTFVVATYDGNDCRLYKNSQFNNSNFFSITLLNSSESLFFGKEFVENAEYSRWYKGTLDDIAIYNRALTQQEITNIYSATSTGGGSNNPYASLSWPQGISYQALARNAQGTPLLNTALEIRFSLLADSINGAVEYAESQNLNSNAQGLINTAFGSGTAITGTWAGINWAKGRKFLKVELNPGTGFVNLGVQELLSVPFSQRSRSAAVLENSSLPVFSGNAAALTGGLLPGQLYRTSAGVLMVVY
jgi:hypothetical protein